MKKQIVKFFITLDMTKNEVSRRGKSYNHINNHTTQQ